MSKRMYRMLQLIDDKERAKTSKMEHEIYLADDGTIRTRRVQRSTNANTQQTRSRMILRDDGTIYNPDNTARTPVSAVRTAMDNVSAATRQSVPVFAKILTWIMMSVCAVAVPLLLNLNNLYRFYKGFGFGLFLLWTMPIFICCVYFFYAESVRSRIIDIWFGASMAALYTTLFLWLGAGDTFEWIIGEIILLTGGLILLNGLSDYSMETFIKRMMIISLCAMFLPCAIISIKVCIGGMGMLSSLNGFLRFIAVLPALVDITMAAVVTVREFRNY